MPYTSAFENGSPCPEYIKSAFSRIVCTLSIISSSFPGLYVKYVSPRSPVSKDSTMVSATMASRELRTTAVEHAEWPGVCMIFPSIPQGFRSYSLPLQTISGVSSERMYREDRSHPDPLLSSFQAHCGPQFQETNRFLENAPPLYGIRPEPRSFFSLRQHS